MTGEKTFEEHKVAKALLIGETSNCPLLSSDDAELLWDRWSIREARDRTSRNSGSPTPSIYYFLERLLVHAGIFLPIESNERTKQSDIYFVPSLLVQADSQNVWTYKTSESFKTTLCHSWRFRGIAPSDVMDVMTVRILRNLYNFSRTGAQINQIMRWKSSMIVKLESDNEVFIALVDEDSSHTVACSAVNPNTQRVVVSGKGLAGNNGQKLWEGGYKLILDSVIETLSNYAEVEAQQVICPDCLAKFNPQVACTWSWDSVLAMVARGSPSVYCDVGHHVPCGLLCGPRTDNALTSVSESSSICLADPLHISKTLPSVVLIAVWDPQKKIVTTLGSGFIVDSELGLVVTAGHVCFVFDDTKESFGKAYNGRAIIGVIPDNGSSAVFRYIADVVAHDVNNVDACVLRISARMEKDVDCEQNPFVAFDQPKRALNVSSMLEEQLQSLGRTEDSMLEEDVRLVGFSQNGEGVLKEGCHISQAVDVVRGYICKYFKFTCRLSANGSRFLARHEIIVKCDTSPGQSGGPCINNEGNVIGILSREDREERGRSYLVPVAEILPLVRKAKDLCKQRPGDQKTR